MQQHMIVTYLTSVMKTKICEDNKLKVNGKKDMSYSIIHIHFLKYHDFVKI